MAMGLDLSALRTLLLPQQRRQRPQDGVSAAATGPVRFQTMTMTRWIAVTGQLFTVLLLHFSLGIELPLALLLPPILLTVLVNLVLHLTREASLRLSERQTLLLLSYDVLQLSFLLEVTGGLHNPFTILILLPVGLGAATLNLRSTILLALLAQLAIIVLAAAPQPLPWFDGTLELPRLYRTSIAIALSLTVLLVAGYTWRLAEDARRQASALEATQLALAREQQLSALGGQAAAAAHLLGTPLGTINVIAKELARELPTDNPMYEEARELLTQVQRCRETLATLGRSGTGDEHRLFTAAPLSVLLDGMAESFRGAIRIEVVVDRASEAPEPVVALAPELRHALTNLIENASQFARSLVRIELAIDPQAVELVIQDDGPGFTPEVLDWLGEPYLSTRETRGGLGLGIFIANTLLARTGASLHYGNNETGAWVRVVWPAGALDALTRETPNDRKSDPVLRT